MKRFAALLVALLLTLAAAAPAAAARPELFVVDHEGTDPLYSCADVFPGDPTYDFVVYDHAIFHYEGVRFYDRAGNLTGWQLHGTGTDNVFRDPNGPVLSGPFNYNTHVDLVSLDPFRYLEQASGTYWNLGMPGEGQMFHEAGQFLQLLEIPTGSDWPFIVTRFKATGVARFDGAAVCEALAG
jgi:hypothetical protein